MNHEREWNLVTFKGSELDITIHSTVIRIRIVNTHTYHMTRKVQAS